VPFTTAVVALGRASGWAITGLMRGIATVVAATGLSTALVIHDVGRNGVVSLLEEKGDELVKRRETEGSGENKRGTSVVGDV